MVIEGIGISGVGEAVTGDTAGEVGLAGMGRGAGVAGISVFSVFSMEAAMESTCISISSSTEIVGVPTGGVRVTFPLFLSGVTGLLLVSVFFDLFFDLFLDLFLDLFFFLPSRLAEA